jgi:hypothetical protein
VRIKVLAVVLAVLGSSCTSGDRPEPTHSPAGSLSATPTSKPTFRPAPVDDFGQLIHQVTGDFTPGESELDAMWRHIFERTRIEGQLDYTPPAGIAGYLASEPPPVECIVRNWADNAFYCPADEWIVYDEEFLRDFESSAGPFAPSAILAHEWGHHIQNLIGVSEYDIQDELQADCFSGMYLAYREVPPGSRTVIPQTSEFNEALVAFFELGNEKYSASTWFQAREHGSGLQRLLAYGTGALPLDRGMTWCYGYRDYIANDTSMIGPDYRLVNLPGRMEEAADNLLVIQPETRTGEDSSTITIVYLPTLGLRDQGATVDQWQDIAMRWLPAGSNGILPGFSLGTDYQIGSGYMALYEPAPDATAPRSGLLALITPKSLDRGLLIDVSRPNAGPPNRPGATPTPADLDVIAEQVVAIFQVLTRLCGPDQSSDIEEPGWSMSCVANV